MVRKKHRIMRSLSHLNKQFQDPYFTPTKCELKQLNESLFAIMYIRKESVCCFRIGMLFYWLSFSAKMSVVLTLQLKQFIYIL